MKDYKIESSSAVFNETIRIPETTDTNHADNINAAPKQIYENTLANRREIEALQKESIMVIFSAAPPATGPMLWFCTDSTWKPIPELVATLALGEDRDNAAVFVNLDGEDRPVKNANREENESGDTVVTIN